MPPQPLPLPVALVLNYAALDFNFTSWMTPGNLRVLRIETEADEHRPRTRSPAVLKRQSSSYFHGSDGEEDEPESWASVLREAKDHLSHVSPLAVVGDEYKRLKLRRKKSWGDTLKLSLGSAATSPVATTRGKIARRQRSTGEMLKHKRSLASVTMSRSKTETRQGPDEDEDEDTDSDEDATVFDHLREEERPLEARIRWFFTPDHTPLHTPDASEGAHGDAFFPSSRRNTLDAAEQAKLQDAISEADNRVIDQRKREGMQRKEAPIGTRLTMTSRTGYFQDRIISPSMVSPPAGPTFVLLLVNRLNNILLYADARDGDPLHRASSEPRFRDGLPHLADPDAAAVAGAVPAAADAVWGEGPVRRRHDHLRGARARGEAAAQAGAASGHPHAGRPRRGEAAADAARAGEARGRDGGGLGAAAAVLGLEPRVFADADADARGAHGHQRYRGLDRQCVRVGGRGGFAHCVRERIDGGCERVFVFPPCRVFHHVMPVALGKESAGEWSRSA